jgi:hypothetical protein
MDDSMRGKKAAAESLWQFLFRAHLPLRRETMLFVLASALDVFMTYILLNRGGFRESNPIADYFISGWGKNGMVFFKFSLVAFVVVVTQTIALKRVDLARTLLNFGTVIVSCVVVYSLVLLLRTTGVF